MWNQFFWSKNTDKVIFETHNIVQTVHQMMLNAHPWPQTGRVQCILCWAVRRGWWSWLELMPSWWTGGRPSLDPQVCKSAAAAEADSTCEQGRRRATLVGGCWCFLQQTARGEFSGAGWRTGSGPESRPSSRANWCTRSSHPQPQDSFQSRKENWCSMQCHKALRCTETLIIPHTVCQPAVICTSLLHLLPYCTLS